MNSNILYQWQVQTMQGELVTSEVIAQSYQKARQTLLARGELPVKLQKIITFSARAWRKNGLLLFTRQLVTLLHSGLSLQAALRLLSKTQHKREWCFLLHHIEKEMARGLSFSQALQQHPDLFGKLYHALIAAGELTGRLEYCCLQLVVHQEKTRQIQQQIHKVLFYPCFTLCTVFSIAMAMILFFIPTLCTLYDHLHAELPALTQRLVRFALFLKQQGSTLFFTLLLLCGCYPLLRRNIAMWERSEVYLLLSLPLLGRILHHACLARFARTLATTQTATISLFDGLKSAGESTGYWIYQQAVQRIIDQIQQGLPLHIAFSRYPLFPLLFIQMVKAGEEASTLVTMLLQIAEFYEERTVEQANLLIKLLEPILIIFSGAIVITIVLSIYLPIFQLGQIIY